MKHTPSARHRERGFFSGKLGFFLIVFAIVFVVKREMPSTPQVMGQSVSTLQVELGQPVHKEQIPRPR